MYYGSRASWNLRDSHMFETLKNLLAFHGADSKAVVWAHNSHVGNAAATEMSRARRVQYRSALPQGVRRPGLSDRLRHPQRHGRRGIRLGWPDGNQDRCGRRLPDSYEQLCHATGLARFMLGLRGRGDLCGPNGLGKERLERAIGVIYRPETELREPLLPGQPAAAVRRVCLVRRDPCRDPAGYRRNQGAAGHLSVRGVIRSWTATRSRMFSRRWTGCAASGSGPMACAISGPTPLDSCCWFRSTRNSATAKFLDQAEWLVAEVDRVLGRARGIRIGEAPDRDGQYFHYLAVWLYALAVLGRHLPGLSAQRHRSRAPYPSRLCAAGRGVIWKMKEDLSGALSRLWPGRAGCLRWLCLLPLYRRDALQPGNRGDEGADRPVRAGTVHHPGSGSWNDAVDDAFFSGRGMGGVAAGPLPQSNSMPCGRTSGYFCREPELPGVKFAFTNYGVSVGLQAVREMPERVRQLNQFFEDYRSGDEYDREAITHVMACSSRFPGYFLRDFCGSAHSP